MDRAEGTGLGVAVVGHALLFALLYYMALSPPVLPTIKVDPIEVDLVDEVDLSSAAPSISPPAPPAATAPEPEAEPLAPPPTPIAPAPPVVKPAPLPKPAPKPVPKPIPKPVVKPIKPVAAKPAPSQTIAKPPPRQTTLTRPSAVDPRDRRRPGLSRDIVAGLNEGPAKPKVAPPSLPVPAAQGAGGSTAIDAKSVQRALATEISRQLKRRWKTPAGADVEQLVTILSWDLAADGSLTGLPRVIDQQGDTPSNRAQAELHRENAIKAVRAAAPFNLPPEHYKYWKSVVSFRFDKRLSQ